MRLDTPGGPYAEGAHIRPLGAPGWLLHQRLELETDLIAAHVLVVGGPPLAQFLG
jgi:hypothetical protein